MKPASVSDWTLRSTILQVVRWVGILLVVLAVAGAGGVGMGEAAGSHPLGGGGVVPSTGRVGGLQIDKSTPADIRRVAGAPAFAGRGKTNAVFAGFLASYEAFGYFCSRSTSRSLGFDPGGAAPTHMRCQTVYFVNPTTGKFAGFWTDSTAFRTDKGSRPGTRQAAADRLEGAHAHVGALTGISRNTRTVTLFIENIGCKPVGNPNTSPCLGGVVRDLIVEGKHPVGLLEDGITN